MYAVEVEQLFQRRGVLDYEFLELLILNYREPSKTHADAFEALGADPGTGDAIDVVKQQALESGALGDHVVQGAIGGDAGLFKREQLKIWEVRWLGGEGAASEGGDSEGAREAEGCGAQRRGRRPVVGVRRCVIMA
jgi:hypothetical protein